MLLIDYFLIFSAIFVTDKKIAEFPLFFLVWICTLFRRDKFYKGELASQAGLIILSPLFIRGIFVSSDPSYYYFYFQAICFVNTIPLIFQFLKKYHLKQIIIVSIIFLLITVFGVMEFVLSSGGRGRFIFGPNMTYRVLAFFYGLLLCCLYINDGYKFKFSILFTGSTFVFLIGMLLTGSRGAILVVTIYIVTILLFSKKSKLFINGLIAISVFIAFIVIYNWDVFELIFRRSFYFNIENNSENYRFLKWTMALNFLNDDRVIFGLTNDNNLLSYYPHNIFLELLFYFGLFPLLIFTLGFACYIAKFKDLFILNLIFLGTFVGSLLSGNLQYNYPVISILTVCIFLMFGQKRKFGIY